MTTAASDIQSVYDEHHKEISRRRDATETHVPMRSTSTFARNETELGNFDTFEQEDQVVALASISHIGFAPVSTDGKGALRIYGAFPDDTEAIAHAHVVLGEDPGVSMVKFRLREWFVVASNPTRLGDSQAMKNKRDEILGMHEQISKEDEDEFKARYALRGQEKPVQDKLESDGEGEEEDDNAPKSATLPDGAKQCKRRLSAQSQVAGQRFAVITCLYPPDDSNGEFLVKVYACFDTTQEADAWVRNAASKQVQKEHLDIVKLYDWIRPDLMRSKDAPAEVFRDQELNNIMQHHRQEPRRVQEYKQWLQDNPEQRTLDNSTAHVEPIPASEAGSSEDGTVI